MRTSFLVGKPALGVVAAACGLGYAWDTADQQPEIYYAAAARSMSTSWHNFFFAAFDPAATTSIDKVPGALWLQALSLRVFGVHVWALNLPQIVAGTLTVLVLYRAVRRVAGAPGAMVAAVVYALTPITVALNRGNVSDSLLVLLLVCAADQVTAAVTSGRLRPLAWAGLWIGLAFQAKMVQAWLVLPAVLVALALSRTPAPRRRYAGAALLLGVTAVVSVSWMVAVSAVPQHDRPRVDGSRHDSVWEQVFVYNGVSRTDATQPSGTDPAATLERAVTLDAVPRADRSLAGPGGRAIGWLLPVAVVAGVGVLWARRRSSGEVQRVAAGFWLTWLAVLLAAFTVVGTLNAYYLAALTPAVAALVGLGAVHVRAAVTDRRGRLVLLAAAAAVVGYGCWLIAPAPTAVRIVVPAVALAMLGVGAVAHHREAALAAALTAVLVAPAAAALAVVHEHGGPFTTPYEPAAQRAVSQAGVAAAITDARAAAQRIRLAQEGARYPVAAFTALLAAPLVFADGLEVLPVGGFTGTNPSPSLTELQRLVAAGELHTFLLVPPGDARAVWVQRSCLPVTVAQVDVYYCR